MNLEASSVVAMLSTAAFDGAAHNTFCPLMHNCRMVSTKVVVLPHPGGPWMAARYGCSTQSFTASRWSPFKFLFMNSISVKLNRGKFYCIFLVLRWTKESKPCSLELLKSMLKKPDYII